MNSSRKIWLVVVLIIGVLLLGIAIAVSISHRIDQTQRARLQQEAEQAALLVPGSSIALLSASGIDLQNPAYQEIKQKLAAFRSYDPSARFVYVLGYKPSLKTMFFYVDSEPIDSKDYSPPGQLFPDTRQKDIDAYLAGVSYTDGPYSDSWGQWVSGYAPIRDEAGNMVALLGIDTATDVWHEQTRFVQTAIILISLLLSVVIGFVVSLVYKKERSIEVLQKENTTLVRTEGKMKEMQQMAQIGRMSIYFPDQTFSFDGQLIELFPITETKKVDRASVEKRVHPDDKDSFDKFIGEITGTDVSYTWADIRLGSLDQGYRTYHIYGTIDRDASLAPTRFSGIIQDITDIHSA